MFKGVLTAVVTPFHNGEIDYESYEKFLEFQLKAGVDGLVVAGSTGEAATLTTTEKLELARKTLTFVNGKVPVILGTGSNNTQTTIELTQKAKEIGVDGVLIVSPYYNKPTQEGLYQHYTKIANAVDIPIVLYNVPGRTANHIQPTTVARLAELPNIVAIKEASGDLNNSTEILQLCGESITLLSGEDTLIYPMMCLGGKGVICTTSNIAPYDFQQLCAAALNQDHETARTLHFKTYSLIRAMFLETNPIPVKHALKLMGFNNGEIRLPLTPPSSKTQAKINEVLIQYGLVNGIH